jgi:cytochrome c oxidase subunit 2
MKQDAVQGITTRTVVKPTKLGTFPVVCTELCGLGHSTMRSQARVLDAAGYRRWIQEQRRRAREGASVQGEQLFASTCGSCHTLADAGTEGQTGPDLDTVLPGQDADSVLQSIVEPNAEISEGFQPDVMPQNYGEMFSEQQLQGLVEYLLEAAGGGER